MTHEEQYHTISRICAVRLVPKINFHWLQGWNRFSTTFIWFRTAFRRFWYIYIFLNPNHRAVMVASIQMLLVQQLLDMAYFYYRYYGHLLFIIRYAVQENTCYLTSQCDYKQQHWIEMLAEAQLHQTTIRPFHRVHRYHAFCLNIECFSIEKRVKLKVSTWILLPVITKYLRPHF